MKSQKKLLYLIIIVITFCSCKSKKQKASERFENSINEYNATRKYENSLEDYAINYIKPGNRKDSLKTDLEIKLAHKTMDSLTKEQDSLMKIIDGK